VAAGFTPDLLPLSGKDSATTLTGSFTLPIAGSYGTEVSCLRVPSSSLKTAP
jgi:hypothetical protein